MAAAETEEGRLALGLVADLLDSLGLRHSLSIFLPEANLDDGTAVGEGQPQQQQQQHPPSHWRSLQQAVVETLELDSDTGSEDPLLLQFMRRQMEKKRLRSESEAKEEGEEGDGKGRKEEGEEEAMLAPGGQEQALAARQQMVEKNGVEEITGAVEEAIAYEEEEEEGRSRCVLGEGNCRGMVGGNASTSIESYVKCNDANTAHIDTSGMAGSMNKKKGMVVFPRL